MKIVKYSLLILCGIICSCGNDGANPEEQKVNLEELTDRTEVEKVESPETRIEQIKYWYDQLQMSGKIGRCTIKTSTIMDGLEKKYPFTNTFESCLLKHDYSYKVATLKGYESEETCTWYYKDGNLFFVFDRGGAEACGFEARVYYDAFGKVMKVLQSTNNCTGDDVGEPVEVNDANSQKEILDRINSAKTKLDKAMNSEER